MASLKGLCNGVSPTRFLQNLKQVIIKDCEELQVIFQIDKLSERMKYQTPLLSNLTILNLHSLPKLKRIWEVKPSHRAIASLQSLKVVTIISCNNLKTIFSPCLALSMLHLQALQISDCNGLEQESLQLIPCHLSSILGLLANKNHCWTKLKTLRIEDCRLLKYVFANTLSQGFPLLESLYLKYCPQLLQVFSSIEGRDVTGDHILLNVPFLKNLEVSNCPQTSCFIVQAQLIEELVLRNMGNSRQLRNTDVPVLNEGCIVVGNHEEVFQVQCGYSFSRYHSVFPSMIELKVKDCPKLTTGFFIDSQEFVHCKTKVPQLVEQDAVEKSTTVRNAIFNENIDWTRGLRRGSQLPHIA
ncbi:hypothetical protein GOBAR_DD13787 [Gossypium barbadense]|nr:hypothetical protein GOBAR_DD13787 [Gossypium barbadense]